MKSIQIFRSHVPYITDGWNSRQEQCTVRGGLALCREDRLMDKASTVVIPAYNEAEVNGEVVGELVRRAPGVKVLVIDDGSKDDTAAVAERAGATSVTSATRATGQA